MRLLTYESTLENQGVAARANMAEDQDKTSAPLRSESTAAEGAATVSNPDESTKPQGLVPRANRPGAVFGQVRSPQVPHRTAPSTPLASTPMPARPPAAAPPTPRSIPASAPPRPPTPPASPTQPQIGGIPHVPTPPVPSVTDSQDNAAPAIWNSPEELEREAKAAPIRQERLPDLLASGSI